MISDPTGEITRNFEVMREGQGLADRGTFVVQTGEHHKREEVLSFLFVVDGASEKLVVEERDLPEKLCSPISFLLQTDGDVLC